MSSFLFWVKILLVPDYRFFVAEAVVVVLGLSRGYIGLDWI